MKQQNVSINRVIKNGMLPVIRKRDILTVRVLSEAEKQEQGVTNGGGDVLGISPSGVRRLYKRAYIRLNYTYLSGRPIKMSAWRTGKDYKVIRANDDTPCRAMPIPVKYTVSAGNGRANVSGRSRPDYVVAEVDQAGNILPETVGIVSSAMFRKMYTIPPNPIVARAVQQHRGLIPRGASGLSKVVNMKRVNMDKGVQSQNPVNPVNPVNTVVKVKPVETRIDSKAATGFDFGEGKLKAKPGMKFGSGNQTQGALAVQNQQQRQGQSQVAGQANAGIAKVEVNLYQATYKIIKKDGNKVKIVGFVLERKGSKPKKCTYSEVMGLCRKRLISNLMVSSTSALSDGKEYIKGNGIKISDLSSIAIN